METWTYSWAFRNILAELLMPPGIWLVGILLALFLFKKRAILQKVSVTFFVIMLWVSSTPAFVQWFTNVADAWMHWPSPIQMRDHQTHLKQVLKNNSAIVVLGGGRRKGAIESPQYQNQDLSPYSLERLRMAARLASETKLPILLTGGAPDRTSDTDLPEAVVMAKILDKEFHQTAKWMETKSQTTQENAAHGLVKNYRESYGIFACTGILFNHESPLRPERFVTQKIIRTAAYISKNLDSKLSLGNISIHRDWGWAPEYVEAMWLMLQQKVPDDFVIATGKSVSLEYFIEKAFSHHGLFWKDHVLIDPSFLRPSDIEYGGADPSKAEAGLGWRAKYDVDDVIRMMSSAIQSME